MAIIKPNNNTISAITALPASITTGKVLQVVTFTSDTEETTTSTSFVGSAKRLSITPSSTSNKILIIYSGASAHNNANSHCEYTLYRETTSTNLGNSNDGINQIYNAGGLGYNTLSMTYLDAPSTSSSVEYRVYFRPNASGTTATLGRGTARSILTLMEIAG